MTDRTGNTAASSAAVMELPPELETFTPEQVRRILRCGKKRIYDLLGSGELPAIRLGRKRWFIRREALTAFLARMEKRQAAEQRPH